MEIKYPLAKPVLGMQEKINLNKCIDDGWVSGGRFVPLFESKLSVFCKREYGCSTSSGTTALHLALLACGVGPGDRVIVPTLTYIATVNAILQCGAVPVFCDSRPSDWQIDEVEVANRIQEGNIKAALIVHLYGVPCDIAFIEEVCKASGVILIEDVAEALGGSVGGRSLGSFGDASCFSFYGNKTLTTGEGGMVLCDNSGIKNRVNHLKNHATVKGKGYVHDRLGYNYRLSNLHAAVGCSQIDRLDSILKRKEEICNLYTKTIFREFNMAGYALSGGVATHRIRRRGIRSGYWLYSLVADSGSLRDGLMNHLAEEKIETRPFFTPCHSMDYMPPTTESFPVATDLSDRGFNLPTYPELTDDDVKYISEQVLVFLRNNVR